LSKISLTPHASGTGIFTVASPNSSTDRTLTLPDETGTVLTDTSAIAASQITGGIGKVLQVVQGTTSTDTSTTGASYVDTGLTATITPTFTSSKILVLLSQNGVRKGAGNGGAFGKLMRDLTTLASLAENVAYDGTTTQLRIGTGWSASYLDSPSTTSATVYKTQFYAFNSVLAGVQSDSATSTITLMEIKG